MEDKKKLGKFIIRLIAVVAIISMLVYRSNHHQTVLVIDYPLIEIFIGVVAILVMIIVWLLYVREK